MVDVLAARRAGPHAAVIRGYHLNKRQWNTVIIDGSLPDRTIVDMVEDSYDLVVSKLPPARQRPLALAQRCLSPACSSRVDVGCAGDPDPDPFVIALIRTLGCTESALSRHGPDVGQLGTVRVERDCGSARKPRSG